MKLKDFFRRWNNPSDPDASLRSSITHFDIHAEKDREGDGWSVGENDDLRWVATCSVRWETDAYPPLLLTQSACGRTRQIEGRRESPEETMARCLDDLHEMLDTGVNRARSLSRRILMSASNARPILTLVLGAGFSCAFGVPTTDGLAGWLSRPCPRFGDLVSNYWSSFPSAFEDAKKESVLGIFGQDKEIKNIEVLLSMWHGERDQWDQTGLTHGTHQDYRCFLENMVAWFVHWSNEAEIGETNKRRFESMVRWLKEAVKRYDVRIVTFNYDLIIERLCRAAGVEFAYFEDGMSRSRVLIRKVHGSANFFEASVGIPQTAQVVFDIDQSIGARMKLDEPPHDWQGNFPVFIPPAASKRYQGIYSWTWWRALCDIAQAEKLLFVGYSFPLLDVVAREYIRRKLWGRNERTVDYVLPPQHRERIKHAIRHHKEDMSVRPNWIGECWEIGHFDQLLV